MKTPAGTLQSASSGLQIFGTVHLAEQAVGGATVRLRGSLDTVGGLPGAARETTAHVAWTRPLTGFAGTLWECWQQQVAQQVAGLNWPAFRAQVRTYNPTLAADGDRFHATKRYRLPENSLPAPAIVWDREVSGFAGSWWQCWQQYVANRVVGLSYAQFRAELPQHNPGIGAQLVPADQIHLPHNVDDNASSDQDAGAYAYFLETVTGARGDFRFADVPPGAYALRIDAPGAERFDMELACAEDKTLAVTLTPRGDDPADRRDTVRDLPATGSRSPGSRSAGGHPWMGVHGDELVAGDRAFRFIGVNVRGLVHYGDPSALRHAQTAHRAEQLQAAYEMGARVARVFLPNQHTDVAETIRRLQSVVELVRTRFPGLYLLPAFANLYGDVPFRIPGDEKFYARVDPHFHTDLLNAEFFTHGYEQNYLPFVRAVVSALRDEPVIMAWEVGNELKLNPAAGHAHNDDPHLEAFIRFMHRAAQEIRSLDPNHLLTTGMISTHHAWLHNDTLQRRLYATPLFDFLTVHCYNEEYENDDSALARALNRPFIVEEAGFGRGYGNDRSQAVQEDMDLWFGRGARGYMQWGFMATANDMGDGDGDSGMDRSLHHDWDALFGVYRTRAAELARFDPGWRVQPARPGLPPAPVSPTSHPPTPLRPEPAVPDAGTYGVGQTVYAQTLLNVRQMPGHLQAVSVVVGQIAPGGAATILGEATVQDGLVWWPVEAVLTAGQSVQGWAANALPQGTRLLATSPPPIDAGSRALARAVNRAQGHVQGGAQG